MQYLIPGLMLAIVIGGALVAMKIGKLRSRKVRPFYVLYGPLAEAPAWPKRRRCCANGLSCSGSAIVSSPAPLLPSLFGLLRRERLRRRKRDFDQRALIMTALDAE